MPTWELGMRSIVEEYWSAVARRLQEEANTFNRLIGHAGEQGRENELSLARLVTNLLPRRLGVGSGIVIDADGKRSRQMDIIVYDQADQPAIMGQTTQVLFPVENVYLAIEVKTTVSDEEVSDFTDKKESILALKPRSGRTEKPLILFSYQTQATPPTVAKLLKSVDPRLRPDLFCAMTPGLLAGPYPLIIGARRDSADYVVGITALHQRDNENARVESSWERPSKEESGSIALRAGSAYPITRQGMMPADRVLGEPGRALLIFCAALLQILSASAAIPEPVLQNYLRAPARELLEL